MLHDPHRRSHHRYSATPSLRPGGRLLAALGAAALSAVVLVAPAAAATSPSCAAKTTGGPVWVDGECVDAQYGHPVVDRTEDRSSPSAHVVFGHFEDTTVTFEVHLPPEDAWQGRFFQYVYPVGDGVADAENVEFALAHGGYLVQTGGATGYRADAAAAKFAREVAAEYYDAESQSIRGYIWGGSGGSYQTVGAIENTDGVWQGAVPFVIGAPTSIPNNFFIRLLARLVLADDAAGIADAVRPGGTGDPYEDLDETERGVLREVSALGVPLRAWDDPGYLFGDGTGLLGFAATVRAIDSTYAADFWSKDGYAGTEDSPLGDIVRAARLDAEFLVESVERGADGAPVAFTLAGAAGNDPTGLSASLLGADGAAAGQLNGTLSADTGRFVLDAKNAADSRGQLVEGMSVRLDNTWALALAFYHRHQVPKDRSLTAWDQFRAEDGSPLYPQRAMEIGPLITRGVTGGASFTGRLTMPTILVANTLDADAYPWQADWYANRVNAALGEATDDRFRLWYNDNADHLSGDAVIGSGAPSVPRGARLIEYSGILRQAILDVVEWVEEGRSPAASTSYSASDQQIDVSHPAGSRGGIQPVADLSVQGRDAVKTRVGEPVTFKARIEAPPQEGVVVSAEWDFDGDGEIDRSSDLRADGHRTATVRETFAFDRPGVYFVTLRAGSQREASSDDPMTLLENLDRVRVVVE